MPNHAGDRGAVLATIEHAFPTAEPQPLTRPRADLTAVASTRPEPAAADPVICAERRQNEAAG